MKNKTIVVLIIVTSLLFLSCKEDNVVDNNTIRSHIALDCGSLFYQLY